jgi:RimJ/RimL family protein N-acetyltransferase
MFAERRHTKRLELIALTAELARLTVDHPEQLGDVLQAAIPADWPPPYHDHDAQVWLVDKLTADPAQTGWLAWYLVWNQAPERFLIGLAGFKGAPGPDGVVEIGYGLVPSYHRQGLAPEACRELIDWALADPAVGEIIAETLPELTPSIRVMEKLGMAYYGAGSEPGVIRYGFRRLGCASKHIPKG